MAENTTKMVDGLTGLERTENINSKIMNESMPISMNYIKKEEVWTQAFLSSNYANHTNL